jgi:hypothetical protein
MHRRIIVCSLAAIFMAGIGSAALSQSPSKAAPKKSMAPFTPGFDDVMTMLVQPRHIRLYYAGTAKNWELAAAEMKDLRQSFDRLGQVIPNYLGNDVNAAVKSLIAPQMGEVDAAIASADPKRFSGAYGHLTTACNACHTYMEHPFIIIKAPSEPAGVAQPDQDFRPAP